MPELKIGHDAELTVEFECMLILICLGWVFRHKTPVIAVSKQDQTNKKQELIDNNPDWQDLEDGDSLSMGQGNVDFSGTIDGDVFEGLKPKTTDYFRQKADAEAFEAAITKAKVGEHLQASMWFFPMTTTEDLRKKKAIFRFIKRCFG